MKPIREVSAATASRKFFDMLEDTVDDFRSAGEVDDNERARLLATILNGQARKYLTDAKTLWPLVCEKLSEMNTDSVDQSYENEPVQTTPTDLQQPTTTVPFGAPSAPLGNPFYMESENARLPGSLREAASVEFYTDPATNTVRARVGSSDKTLEQFVKGAGEQEDMNALVKGILSRTAEDDSFDSPAELITAFAQEKDNKPDIIAYGDEQYIYDEDELNAAL